MLRIHLRLSIAFGITLIACAAVSAGAAEPMPEDIAFRATLDGREERYMRILPAGFEKQKPHDVLIALHGHGSDRRQFAENNRDECRAARDVAKKHGMIFISPDYRAKTSWMGPAAEADVVQIIQDLKSLYSVRHVVISGASMGGTSCLTFAVLRPELVDGVVSMNGTANHVEYHNFQDAIAASFGGTKQQVPEEYKKRSAELHADKLTMPIACTTGGLDKSVPSESVVRMMDALKKQGRPVLLLHRPNGGHSTNYADGVDAYEFVLGKLRAKPAP